MSKSIQPIFFCAQQRSGTTVLQRTLEDSGILKNYGEVFHHARADECAYFEYRMKLLKNQAALSLPTGHHQKRLFNRYLKFLASKAGSRSLFLVDVKYNSWHHFNTVWHLPTSPPNLLKLIRLKGLPVLHIKRNNVFNRFLSGRLALETKTYHYANDVDVNEQSLTINTEECKLEMMKSLELQKLYSGYLSDYKNAREICYEEMFDKGVFSSKTNEVLSWLIGEEVELKPPVLKKISKDYKKIVKNFEEVLDYFSNSEFEGMIKECFKL